MFAYCNNNPVMYKDKDGTFVISLTTVGIICLAAVVTAVTVGAISAANSENSTVTPITGPEVSPIESNILAAAVAINWILNGDQADSKADSPANDTALPPPGTVFYEAFALYPGAAVLATVPLTTEEAVSFVLLGFDIWSPNLEYAMLIAIAASGGYMGPERNGNQNAIHLHLKDHMTSAHIFYGYGTNIEFIAF